MHEIDCPYSCSCGSLAAVALGRPSNSELDLLFGADAGGFYASPEPPKRRSVVSVDGDTSDKRASPYARDMMKLGDGGSFYDSGGVGSSTNGVKGDASPLTAPGRYRYV